MESKDFSLIRHYLDKPQSELAKLLCVSPKTIQSFEQGWRKIPAYISRQLLFLLSLKTSSNENIGPCWEIKGCPVEWRENCSAWEFKAGNLCWFINGTFCRGQNQECWDKKLEACWECEVFLSMIPPLI